MLAVGFITMMTDERQISAWCGQSMVPIATTVFWRETEREWQIQIQNCYTIVVEIEIEIEIECTNIFF